MPAAAPPVGFLDLPTEIRLMIYNLTLQDSTEITIATVLDEDADLSGRSRWHIPGLPDNHVPVVRNGYDEKLLDFSSFAPQHWTSPPPVKLVGTSSCPGSGVSTPMTLPSGMNTPIMSPSTPLAQTLAVMNLSGSYFTLPAETKPTGSPSCSPYALLATCRQIQSELDDYLTRSPAAPLTLHISYPYGILVLWHQYPALLETARTVNIAGFFTGEWAAGANNEHVVATPNSFGSPTRTRVPTTLEVTAPNLYGPTTPSIAPDTAAAAPEALKHALAALTQRSGRLLPHIASVTLRSFTPRATDHKVAVYCDAAPPLIAMQSVGEALLETWAWRAKGGCAWVVKMRPCLEEAQGRWVSNSWPSWGDDGREDWLRLITGEMPLPEALDWGITVLS